MVAVASGRKIVNTLCDQTKNPGADRIFSSHQSLPQLRPPSLSLPDSAVAQEASAPPDEAVELRRDRPVPESEETAAALIPACLTVIRAILRAHPLPLKEP